MGKKLFKLLSLCVAVVMSCIAIIWWTPLPRDNYLSAIVDKHRILEAAASPKIIFIGGSNLAFGMDCALIRRTLDYNVVNMGLHNGFGLRYIMNEIKDQINPGDIIVIIHEYDLNLEGAHTLLELVLYFPGSLKYLQFTNYMDVLKNFPVTLQRRFEGYLRRLFYKSQNAVTPGSYNRNNFNEYGDNTGHLNLPTNIFPGQRLNIHLAAAKPIEAINQFKRYVSQKGARLFFTFPPAPTPYFTPKKAVAAQYHILLKKKLECPVLGAPEDFVYPENHFFDTIYHLNKTGRYLRTVKIISELARELRIQIKPTPAQDMTSDLPKIQAAIMDIVSHRDIIIVDGFKPVEGPYPAKNIPLSRWGLGPVSRIHIQTGVSGKKTLRVKAKCLLQNQVMSVFLNGAPLGDFPVTAKIQEMQQPFQTLALTLDLKKGDNEVVFKYNTWLKPGERGAGEKQPIAVLFSRLELD